MIADDIINKIARHGQIKPAVEELVDDVLSEDAAVKSNTARVAHEFECEVRGQKFDVEISIRVATKKKH